MTTILIIDDSSFQRTIIRKTLTSEGYRCIEADNGRVALGLIAEEQPDIIIVDLLMPDMDGIEFLTAIREKKISIPVIVLTSDIQDATREKCIQLGASSFLNKPTRADELIPAIRLLLPPGEGE
ncbi:histidine kinase [Methanocalculus chunghsingensis]|uniref:Histidine kinase n=1 Tax=Methanocalculus chunghsingensis TaxID=156457 RepID=A0A8J7WAH6_9EURY|nr:response regulator [Methanocalculus chunghsingensis]MBR1369305.1 histidine kinase [Methanocalculus chunghsingensis]